MFPCTKCGLCCQHIETIEELKDFDVGNGVCKYFNTIDNSCSIYETRPDICRIDKMYEIKYKYFFTKNDFYIENAKICNKLQETHKFNKSFRIIIGD